MTATKQLLKQTTQQPRKATTPEMAFPDMNPMSSLYQQSRDRRARPPTPVEYHGRPHDVMGVSPNGQLVLRDQSVIHQDVRLEDFAGRSAMLDGICSRIVSLEAVPGPHSPELVPILRLQDLEDELCTWIVLQANMSRVRLLEPGCEYKLGHIKHGIMRLISTSPRSEKRTPLRAGQRFEARLHHRLLEGPFEIEMGANGQLTATNSICDAKQQHIVVEPEDIAPRYRRIFSLDFRGCFDVDIFVYHEDRLRSQASATWPGSVGLSKQESLLGMLPIDTSGIDLTNGTEHLQTFARFIRKHIGRASKGSTTTAPRELTILNLSMSNQGDARCTIDALLDFRKHNRNAHIHAVVSKLGPTDFQQTSAYSQYLEALAENGIEVNDYTNTDPQTRQVMHGKAIIIDDHVLFSTGAIMDTRPINKADFSFELPASAALIFRNYVNETIHHGANHERHAVLAAELAGHGVVINDPVASLTYISRAQDALIRRARHHLLVSVSELVDPIVTKLLLRQVARGIHVTLQVRELDPRSARLLARALRHYDNLKIEDSSWWEPRPHWNAIIADGTVAYVGSCYLWSTQRNMIHQGRSFENGALLQGEAAWRVYTLIDELRRKNTMPSVPIVTQPWSMQYRLAQSHDLQVLERMLKQSLPGLSRLEIRSANDSESKKADFRMRATYKAHYPFTVVISSLYNKRIYPHRTRTQERRKHHRQSRKLHNTG